MTGVNGLITRRDTLKAVAAAVLGTGMKSAPETTKPGPAVEPAGPSRLQEFAWVRGFNYQPSWGSHGITIWNDFREATFAREVELGLKHFPKLNTLRIWFSYDAHVADPARFLGAAKRAAELLAERKVRMIPVIFNGWHSLVEFGGFSREQLAWSARQYAVVRPAPAIPDRVDGRRAVRRQRADVRRGERALQQRWQGEGERRVGVPRGDGRADSRPRSSDADLGRHAGLSWHRRARGPEPARPNRGRACRAPVLDPLAGPDGRIGTPPTSPRCCDTLRASASPRSPPSAVGARTTTRSGRSSCGTT